MAGPFPGMDPYLELPEFWRDFHSAFIPALRAQLTRILPAGFAAYIEERIYVITPELLFVPDVVITKRDKPIASGSAGSALLERVADGSEMISFLPDRALELYIEVRRAGGRRGEVIAAIALLSPTNKQQVGHGRDEYRAKQGELIESQAHLVEIDLLRGGIHTVAAPRDVVLQKGRWDHIVSLHRAGDYNTFEVWRNLLTDRLPRIKVPLVDGHHDAVLDLQEALDTVYDSAPYEHEINYHLEPEPPLSEDYRAWSDALLREKGFRS